MITAALATLVAGLSLMLPSGFRWNSPISVLQLDMLTSSQPRATAIGALVALIIAVFVTTVDHVAAAWGAALCGTVVMFATHLPVLSDEHGIAPSTLNYLDSLAGGALLGGIAVAVLRGRLQVFGWTFGALAAIVFGQLGSTAAGEVRNGVPSAPGWSRTLLPPLWLIVITLGFLIAGTVVNRSRDTVERRSVELPVAPIFSGLAYVTTVLFASHWLGDHAGSVGHIVMASALTVAAAVVAAVLLPRRDGVLILLAVALSAVGGALVPARLPLWSVVPLLALIALGLIAGFRRPAPAVAAVVLIAVALTTVVAAPFGSGLATVAVTAVLALVAGYCFGSAAPRYNPARVLGVSIIFVPSVVTSLREHLGREEFVPDPGQWSLSPAGVVDSAAPYWAATGIAAGCAVALWVLQRLRPPSNPTAARSGRWASDRREEPPPPVTDI